MFSLALLIVATACPVQDLQFRHDRRLEITSPADRGVVNLPIVIQWTIKDFEVKPVGEGSGSSAGHFGVFVDVTPQPPGEGLEYFTRRDPACQRGTSCLTTFYLAQRGVFQTTETTFRITNIAKRFEVPKDQQDWHEVTVVLLDGQGHRIGEFGDWVTIKLRR